MSLVSIENHFKNKLNEAELIIQNFPWEDKDSYTAWLAQQYYLVRHSSRFLGLAISKIDDSEIRNGYIKHLSGERNHDELLIKDLKSLGRQITEFPELPSTRLLIHNQYYWLNESSPASLFGYSQYLEGISVFSVPKVIKRLEASGMKTLSFLKVHADSDETHYPEGFDRIDRLGETAEGSILPNLEESHMLYMQIFFEIQESLKGLSQKRAA
jgi:hypothetical protein